ncbi:MAG: DUF2807 domain-containing protein [Anaerolineales bacterium]|nr:DUF2807 domain-containing protein [Anaerolineales bacterium]
MSTRIARICLLLLSLSLLLVACGDGSVTVPETVNGSGNVVSETREVSDFSRVTLNGVGQLIIEQSGTETLEITADDNLMQYLETAVRGDTLEIGVTEGIIFTDVAELTFRVTVSSLEEIELNGAGEVELSQIDTDRLTVQLSGAGSVTAAGSAADLSVTIDGAGSFDGADLASETADVTHNGAGSAVVRVSERLDAEVNGIGTIEYIGSPTVNESINGLGNVSQREP